MPVPEFPCGLFQPAGSYKFGMDALLLAAFGRRLLTASGTPRQNLQVAEAGCGCGAAMLGLGLEFPQVSILGIEKEPELADAASHNARLLELENRSTVYQGDLGDRRIFGDLIDWQGKCALVMANPPWRTKGRHSPSTLRARALSASEDSLFFFCRGAEWLLAHHGRLGMILPPDMLPELCVILEKMALGLKTILPVASFRDESASRVLVSCQKNAISNPVLEAPLAMRERRASGHSVPYAAEALAFCPWLDLM